MKPELSISAAPLKIYAIQVISSSMAQIQPGIPIYKRTLESKKIILSSFKTSLPS